MVRMLVVGALVVSGCQKSSSGVDPSAGSQGLRAATLRCTLSAPSGWTPSAAPMPDHVAELIANAPGLQGRMVVKESAAATVAEAAAQQKERTVASSGSQPDFTLLREDPLGEGRVILYQWRPQPSAPIERHLIALLPLESKVLLAVIDDDGATPEEQLLESLRTIRCTPK